MTKIKLCGLRRVQDVTYVNELLPEYVGFVFAPASSRYLTVSQAEALRSLLDSRIIPVGVFVNADLALVEALVHSGIIGAVQLHGSEDRNYLRCLRQRVSCPVIQAFCITSKQDVIRAEASEADFLMLDTGGGTGRTFDHSLAAGIHRDFFLAGGLDSENVTGAIARCHPYAVDASSSLETEGKKDKRKMEAFVKAVREGRDDIK